jgi:HlyD family secretion protein
MIRAPLVKRIAWESARLLGLIGLLIVLMLWLSGTFLTKIAPGPPVTLPRPPAPTTVRAQQKTFASVVRQVGTVQARRQAQVSSRAMGQIREIAVHDGEHVAGPGQADAPTVLARLDDREIRARIRQAEAEVVATAQALAAAEAQLAVAQAQVQAAEAGAADALADFDRYQNLYRKQSATGQQMDHARARKDESQASVKAARQQADAAQKDIDRIRAQQEASQAALDQARVMLSYTTIQAPFTGTVARKMVDVGDMVSPGSPLFLLETASEPELHGVVAQSLVPRLRVGAVLQVHIDALASTVEGTVRDMVHQANPRTRTVTVKISLPPDPRLLSGMSGSVDLEIGEYEAIVVPRSAVQEVGQLHLVRVVGPEGRVHRQYVTLGERHGELVEVLSGLAAGQEVVIP